MTRKKKDLPGKFDKFRPEEEPVELTKNAWNHFLGDVFLGESGRHFYNHFGKHRS